jgi:hypothetical protein
MKKVNYLKMVFVVLISVLSLGIMTAGVEAIEYQFTGEGVSGSLFDSLGNEILVFDNANFSISIPGTGPIATDSFGALRTNQTGSITLTGSFGTYSGDFLDPLYLFTDYAFELVGFGTGSNFDPVTGDTVDQLFLYVPSVGLDTYSLNHAFGPIYAGTGFAGTSVNNFFASNLDFFNAITQFGQLVFDDVEKASFTAVPEPASMILLCSGLFAIVGFRRKLRS